MSKDKNNLLIKNLVEFGLSEKEASIYISLLELELASVNEIAKKTGINRSSAYVVLESLKTKGLVGTSDDKKVRQYVAANPETLRRVAIDTARKHHEISKSIESIVPELKILQKDNKYKPKVSIFEGKEGVIAAFEDSLTSKEKIMRVYSSPGNLGHIIPDYLRQYIIKRFNLGIRMYGIHPNDEIHKMLVKNSPKNFDKSVLIPKEKYNFPADLAIYDNKIGYMSPEDGGIAVIIESEKISDVMKGVFDLAFEKARSIESES